MNRFEAEALIRDLTGGDTPEPGETIIFDPKLGWTFGLPTIDGVMISTTLDSLQAQIDALDARVTALEGP